MLKQVLVALCAILIVIPSVASAHSTLQSAKPGQDETITTDVKKLEMSFNANLEKGSSLTLQREGEEIKVDSIKIEGDKLIGLLAQPLQNGTYTVIWKIIGEDGHPVEGKYAFTVKDSDNTGSMDSNEKHSTDQNAENETLTTDEETKTASAQSEQQQKDGFSSGLIAVIVALGLIAAIGLGWMFKGRKE